MAIRNEWYLTYLTKLPDGLEKFVAVRMLEHRGKDMAIRREQLVAMAASRFPKVKAIDRTVRNAIEKLRDDDWMIGMSHDGDGYFLITSQEEFDAFADQYSKRAYTIIKRTDRLAKVAAIAFAEPMLIQSSLF